MNRRRAVVLAAASALLLSACATPYGPAGLTGGYKETKIDDTTWHVSFRGNGNTPQDKVFYYWIYRCAELTATNGFEYFAPMRPGAQPAVFRSDDEARAIRTKGGSAPSYIYIPGGTVRTWSANAVIRMFNLPAPTEAQFAMSAPKVMELLKDYVGSAGVKEAPSREELARQAGRRFGPTS